MHVIRVLLMQLRVDEAYKQGVRYYRMQWTVVVVCIYFVHLYFVFVFSSRKHRENVFIWCIYLTRLVLVLMHHHGALHSVILNSAESRMHIIMIGIFHTPPLAVLWS